MADDIVKRLTTQSETVVRLFGSPDGPEDTLLPADLLWFTCRDAAAEIERLRAAGDQLAYHVRAENAKEMYTAVRKWKEARHG